MLSKVNVAGLCTVVLTTSLFKKENRRNIAKDFSGRQ
jgi:hypothetical protein